MRTGIPRRPAPGMHASATHTPKTRPAPPPISPTLPCSFSSEARLLRSDATSGCCPPYAASSMDSARRHSGSASASLGQGEGMAGPGTAGRGLGC